MSDRAALSPRAPSALTTHAADAETLVVSGRRVVFTSPGEVRLLPFAERLPAAGRVALRATRTLISTGTEGIVLHRRFAPGTHWDAWIRYPFAPGYSAVGVVEAVGPGVSDLRVGDRVAYRAPHASRQLLEAAACTRIPDAIDDRRAAWFALAKIGFMGARAAQYTLGDSVLIIGAGPIGQMSVRWARAAGVRSILVVDPLAGRLALARAGGATAVIDTPIEQATEAVRAAGGGALPRVVIDGTGNHRVFASALALAADRGRVVVLGDTGTPGDQRLASDVIVRGLSIVGAHDGHEDATWNQRAIAGLFFDLAGDGRFALDGLDTHCFQPADCAAAYALAETRRGETMGIAFDWNGSDAARGDPSIGASAAAAPGDGAGEAPASR